MKIFKRLFISFTLFLSICSGAWASSDAINGAFSVSSTKKVAFSKGNLQQVNGIWQFAEHQYDYFGANQSSDHLDMFAFNEDFSVPDSKESWYILSQSEWTYLYTTRSVNNTLSEDARFIKVTIGGTYRGMILFPDNYTHPEGTDFVGSLFNYTGADDYTATVSLEGWTKMEDAGAVFLPAAGYSTGYSSYGNAGCYHSTTKRPDAPSIYYMTPTFYVDNIVLDDCCYYGTKTSVRFVCDATSYTVPTSGIGSFSTNVPITLPKGLKAYYCKNYDSETSKIETKGITGTIPANTGVLLRGTAGETYAITASSETPEAISDNALVAVTEATHVDQTDGDYTNFMMKGGKFIKIAASSNPDDKLPANRAYLPILTSALSTIGSNSIEVKWDEETSISNVNGNGNVTHKDAWYSLDGRKLNGIPAKGGVYINNGKKVVK